MHKGLSWDKFVNLGDESFISKIAELQLILSLNAAQAGITLWGPYSRDAGIVWHVQEAHQLAISKALTTASRCIMSGYWMEGYTWQCSNVLAAKLWYRAALLMKFWGNREDARHAVMILKTSVQLVPNDQSLQKAYEDMIKWERAL